MDTPLHIIEPCGFVFDEQKMKRVAMDYAGQAACLRHDSWEDFVVQHTGRTVLLTTKARQHYCEVVYQPGDALVLGRESAGVPEWLHDSADITVKVPIAAGARSLNVVQAAIFVLGEALRQTGQFPTGGEQ